MVGIGDNSLMKLLRNEANVGFGATCNRGYVESNGEVVLFLNSDTVVPRAGLIRLIESLTKSGTVGAAGPHSNNVGYCQPIPPTYTSLDRLDLFAQDFAAREVDDEEVPILVGFCLAVRRSVLREVGIPLDDGNPRSTPSVPFDPRFGRGLFEDNDLTGKTKPKDWDDTPSVSRHVAASWNWCGECKNEVWIYPDKPAFYCDIGEGIGKEPRCDIF
jgi:cellulose synthase/poly-beta-1,6-N-acetylglucosamine synthase-like glycosyltransferase